MSNLKEHLKSVGTKHFKANKFEKAIEFYTLALKEDIRDHTIYSNRSACYNNLKKYEEALKDGDTCIELDPEYAKGYQRKAMALHGLGELAEALDVYEKG
jgi:stress-induced-phosphoprotein 1